MRNKAGRLNMLYSKAVKTLASNYFFYGVIFISALQALWYILSFKPWINDEARHFANIAIYSHHLTPFLGNQQPAWDYLGEIVRDGSFMFYYIMSWPLRLIELFSQSYFVQVVGLRIVCLVFFILGVYIYRKVLLEINSALKPVINLTLLFFITIPTVAILPATVNYDDLVFLLFACTLLISIRLLKAKTVDAVLISSLIILGLLMSVVKWTSVALFVPILLFVVYDLYKKHNKKIFKNLLESLRTVPKPMLGMIIVGVVLTAGLFIERPVLNVIKYGRPDPVCQAVISEQRCEKFNGYVEYANLSANKPADFSPYSPIRYFLVFWSPRMISTADNLFEKSSTQLPIIVALYELVALGAVVIILVGLRELLKNKLNTFLLFTTIVYLAALFLQEYQTYLQYGAPSAIRARYLIPVLPILIYLASLSLINLFAKYRKTLLSLAIITLLVSTQGGSIVTYSLTTPQNAYWDRSKVRAINQDIRGVLAPLVKQ